MANTTSSICVVEETTVEVRDGRDRRIGYVSCECNEFVGRLLDGGKLVEGRLTAREQVGAWCRLVMEVRLND